MSEWESKVWFEYSDIVGTVKSGSDTGGSGTTPKIGLTDNFSILSEFEDILFTETQQEIYLENT